MFKWGLVFGMVSTLIGYTIIAAVIAQRLTRPRRRYPNIEPTAVGLDDQDIWFPARGETLNLAAWHVPFAYSSRVAQFFMTALATPGPAMLQMCIAGEVGSVMNRFADRTSE